jgi:hypothetical protein
VVVAANGGCPDVLFFQWRIQRGGGPPVAGPVLYFFAFFLLFVVLVRARRTTKTSLFAVRLQSGRTAKPVAVVPNGLSLGNVFAVRGL